MIHPIQLARRIRDFPKRPLRSRVEESYVRRWKRLFPNTPAPIRFRGGLWWTLDMDFVDTSLLDGGYETAELLFISRFVKRGMTVLDIGAHRGLHTITLSKRVGKYGRVLSFEPSPRSAQRLKLHLRMNLCRNVHVRQYAIGDTTGTETLYEVSANSVLNSLRPPDTDLPSKPIPVQVKTLDDVLSESKISRVDFVKIDAEGAELAVLKGAQCLLQRVPRPLILCEVLDWRTRPWGYAARRIVEHLLDKHFGWFELSPQATLSPLETSSTEFDGNFVAVPEESLHMVADLSAARIPSHESSEDRIQTTNEAACYGSN